MALTIDFTKDIRYQQGIEVGEEKGMKKGIEKGFVLGEEKANANISLAMIKQGYSFEQIKLVTGLDLQTLK